MNASAETRVGVYIDFDNIVISRYNQLHTRGQFQKDHARDVVPGTGASPEIANRLDEATVDLGAILDFASSFGTIGVSRAYADWSVPINASYRRQLIDRAVDLVQLFPVVASMKNGADIRLAVDVVEDLFRLSDLTHVVIVAGDSDYIALAQRAKLLGRYVVGIGVAGGTSKALAAACDEFADYDALPGTVRSAAQARPKRKADGADAGASAATPAGADAAAEAGDDSGQAKRGSKPKSARQAKAAHEAAGDLLTRALELGAAKYDEDWQASGNVKNQMLRMDPTFQERALGFSSFTDFVKSMEPRVEIDETHPSRRIRLRPLGTQLMFSALPEA
ncbi:NYN domain-containing protein [Kitasatospora indigofera]|uniref:NYN domain-containing protein n=1 Tax=Kitasatospora indigofera TaxID=67307 RepID=UPI0036CFBBC8